MIATTTSWQTYWGLGVGLAIVGLGVGVAMTLSTDAVVGAVPAKRAGAASAVAETGYELGGAFGIAILGSIHGLLYRDALALPAGVADAEAAAAKESLAAAVYASDDSALIAAAQTAFASAMEATAWIAAAVLAVSAVVAWRIIPSVRVEGQVQREH
ncbi:hypothetical protein GCM10009668_19330 [Nocardioides dubius]|uniref:Major facilitator superfamily (MFS) profile domain-containing protein n=1 Tax=Nocardioides dubius TaxID=317019 RepID=A0ABP4EDA8_9ACTN